MFPGRQEPGRQLLIQCHALGHASIMWPLVYGFTSPSRLSCYACYPAASRLNKAEDGRQSARCQCPLSEDAASANLRKSAQGGAWAACWENLRTAAPDRLRSKPVSTLASALYAGQPRAEEWSPSVAGGGSSWREDSMLRLLELVIPPCTIPRQWARESPPNTIDAMIAFAGGMVRGASLRAQRLALWTRAEPGPAAAAQGALYTLKPALAELRVQHERSRHTSRALSGCGEGGRTPAGRGLGRERALLLLPLPAWTRGTVCDEDALANPRRPSSRIAWSAATSKKASTIASLTHSA